MTFQKGNTINKGRKNPNAGRKSSYQELASAELLWEMFYGDLSTKEMEKKIKSGKHSLSDKFLEKAMNGNERILSEVFKKLFPEKYEHDLKKPVNIVVTRGGDTDI